MNNLFKSFKKNLSIICGRRIIAKDKKHLRKIINNEIKMHGNNCDLNHIDISNINDLSELFFHSKFNGDISQWNTSSVIDMHGLFQKSQFNGNILNPIKM